MYMARTREKIDFVVKSRFLVLNMSSNAVTHKGTQVLFKHRNNARALQ